jgi:hypothetical protein
MGRACSMNGRRRMNRVYLLEAQKERDHQEDRLKWVDSIKIYLTEIRMWWYGPDRSGLG